MQVLRYNDESNSIYTNFFDGIKNVFSKNKYKFDPIPDDKAQAIIGKFNRTTLSAKAFADELGGLDTGMVSYLSTCDNGSATMAGYSKSIENVSIKAKAASVAMKGLSIAGNMLLGLGMGMLIQGGLTWIDNYIHRTERLIEAGDKARSSISETMEAYNNKVTSVTDLGKQFAEDTNSIKTTADAIDSLTKKYSELKNGVNPDNSNASLSSNEYQQYLDISNQLSSLFPALKTGADSQGNALISLGTNAGVAAKSLQELLDTQMMITHTDVSGKAQDVFKGANAQSKDAGKEIKQLKTERKSLEKELDARNDIQSSFKNGILSLSGIHTDDVKKVKEALGKTLDIESSDIYGGTPIPDGEGNNLYTFMVDPDTPKAKIKKASSAVESALKYNTQILTGQLGETNAKLTAKQEEQKQAWASFADEVAKPFIQTSPQLKNVPQELTQALTNNLPSMDWSSIYEKYNGDANFALLDAFVVPLQSMKKPAQEALTEALQLDPSKLSIDEYEKQVNTALEKVTSNKSVQEDWRKNLGFDNIVNDAKEQADMLANVFTDKKKEIDSLSGEERELAYKIAIEDEGFNGAWQDVMSKVQQLQTVATNSSLTFDGLLQSAAGWMQKIDNVNAALVNSVSGKGLNFDYEEDKDTGVVTLVGDLANLQNAYKDLDGYDPALLFERTANGVHLNREALRLLQAQEEATNKQEFINKRLDLQNELNEAISQQQKLVKDSDDWNLAQSTIDSLTSQIQNVDLLASAYEGATSAFQKWINAQSAGEEGDMYDSIRDTAIDRGKELYKKGLVGTEEFRAIADLFSYEDLSTAPIEQVVSAYENAAPTIKKFFTDGREGVDGFVESMKSISDENNMGWVDVLEDGSYKFNTGNDDAIAKALGIDVEAVQAIYKKLNDYGAEGIKIGDTSGVDNYSDRLKELETNAESAKNKLNEMAGTDLKFNFDSQSIENLTSQIDQANQIVQNLPKNEDGSINVNANGAQEAITVLQTLIQKREELASNQNVVMRVKADDNAAVDTLQKFQQSKDELDTLSQMNQQGISIDTTEAQTSVDNLLESVKKIADEHPELEIDTSSADALEESLSHLTEEQLLQLGVDTSQLDTAQEKLAAIKGMNDVNVSVIVNGEADVDTLGNELSSLPPNTPTNVSVNIQNSDQLDGVVQQIEQVPPDTTANFTFTVQNAEEAETLSSKIAELNQQRSNDNQITYSMNIVAGDTSAQSQIESLTQPKEANVTVNVSGQENIALIKSQIDSISDKTINIGVNSTGTEQVSGLHTSIEKVKPKSVDVKGNVSGTSQVKSLSNAINKVLSKSVNVSAQVMGTSAVNALASAISSVRSKSVVITAVTNNITNNIKGKAWGTLSPAHANGTAYNVINTTPSYALGKVALDKDETALVNEMGTEGLIRNGQLIPIPGGMHFQSLKKGDIILSVAQMKSLFATGKASGHGKAYADGTVGNIRNLVGHSLSGAYSSGTYKPGSNIGGSGSKSSSSSSKKSSSSNTSTKSTNNNTAAVKKNTDATNKNTEEQKTTIDWIKQAIDNGKNIADSLKGAIDDFEMHWGQNSAIDKMISGLNSYRNTLRSSQNNYMAKANALNIPSDYVKKIRAGRMQIEDISDKDLAEKVQKYQDWYNTAKDLGAEIQDINRQIREFHIQKMDNIKDDYDNMNDLLKSFIDYNQAISDYSEDINLVGDSKVLSDNLNQYNQMRAYLVKAEKDLTAELNWLVKQGIVGKNTDTWNKWQAEINGVKESIIDCDSALNELKNNIREIRLNDFNISLDNLDFSSDMSSSIRDLMSEEGIFDDDIKLTQTGYAQLGLLGTELVNAKQKVANYNAVINALKEDLKNGNVTQAQYNEKLKEYQKDQMDAVKATSDARKAILDIVKNGIQKETEAMEKLIDKRKKAFEEEKRAYDWQKKVSDNNKDRNKIIAQLAAMEGDDSAETVAKRKKLNAELQELDDKFDEERRDHEYDSRNDAYDDQLEKYKESQDKVLKELETNLETQNQAIADSLGVLVTNHTDIYDQLKSLAEEYNFTLTDDLISPWKDALVALEEYKKAIGDVNADVSIDTSPIKPSNNPNGNLPNNDKATNQDKSQTGTWLKEGNKWWYQHQDGSYSKNSWEKINGSWYHFDDAGWMQTGWVKDKGKWYYTDNSGAMKTGWQKVNDKWYYMDGSGAMQTGWQTVSGKQYYLDSSGAMKTGWIKDKGKWFFLENSGAMATNKYVQNPSNGTYYWVNAKGEWEPKWDTKNPNLNKYASVTQGGGSGGGGSVSSIGGNLSHGMVNENVGKLQQALKALGYYKGNLDNSFGDQTYAAVFQFQRDNGISADGIVGKDTKAKFKAKGYASGTKSATAGLHQYDEYGSELIMDSEGNKYRIFKSGDMVFDHNQTERLWNFSKGLMPQPKLPDIKPNFSQIIPTQKMGGDIVNVHYDNLLNVNGDITRETFPGVEKMCKMACDYTRKHSVFEAKKKGLR